MKKKLITMRKKGALILLLVAVFPVMNLLAQKTTPAPLYPVPSQAQVKWLEMELNAFIHFTTNTFTDLEWGYGDEKPEIFNPTQLDAEQWMKTLRDAGFKGAILTAKHHDGFCLFPSKYTEHSVKNSPYKNGKGDVVREASDAAKKYGLQFGVYLSPWDRNHKDYGTPAYIDYYRNQLKELFTQYGPVFEMWFDGANGGDGYYGGAREKRIIDKATHYDWPNTLKMVRKMQPNTLFFSDGGPDIRWVGNEEGIINRTNWSMLTIDTLYAGKPGILQLLNTGSEYGKNWVNAEADVSIRPGWFYHAKEDDKVKSTEKLFDLYLKSVGRGGVFLVNIPPDRRGLFHENDVKSLQGFRKILNETFAHNLAKNAKMTADTYRGKNKRFAPSNLTDGNKETYFATNDGITNATLTVTLQKKEKVSYILLQEYIRLGQRVKSFSVEVWNEATKKWENVANETTIGYKRILKINPVETQKIRITINDARACPLLSNLEVY